MKKESFARVFGLGDRVNTVVITKCLAAGILLGTSVEKANMAKSSNPRLTRDVRRQHILKNVGKQFPGLKEEFTSEQAEILCDLLNENAAIFSSWE